MADLKQNNITNVTGQSNVRADCTISIKDEDFVSLASGTANPQQVSFR